MESLVIHHRPNYHEIKKMKEGDFLVHQDRICVRVREDGQNVVFTCPFCTRYVDRKYDPLETPKIVEHSFKNKFYEDDPMEGDMLFDCGARPIRCPNNELRGSFKFHLFFIGKDE